MSFYGAGLASSTFILIFVHSLTGVVSDEVLLSCSFETSCGLTQTRASQYNWLPESGDAGTSYTGPSNDHTLRNSNGRYIYAPSSNSRSQRGLKSTLYTPEYRLTSGRGRLEFYYHMWDGYGSDDMGSLNVYVCGSDTPAVWSRYGNQGNRWKWTDEVEFSCQTTFRVFFEAVRGRYQSDIAVDDLKITDIFSPTTPPSTTQMSPTSTTPMTTTEMMPTTTEKPLTTRKPLTTTRKPLTTTKHVPTTTGKIQVSTKTLMPAAEPTTRGPQTAKGPIEQTTVSMTTLSLAGTEKSTPENGQPEGTTEEDSSLTSAVLDFPSPNEKNSSESPTSFIGPIVVVSVGLLFIAVTMCLAVSRKRCIRFIKPTPPVKTQSVKYKIENPNSHGSVTGISPLPTLTSADTDRQANSKQSKGTNAYTYQELLMQQSYSTIEETGMETHQSMADRNLSNNNSYQEITNALPGKESDLYADIPENKDGNNEYSYAYVINPAEKIGASSNAPPVSDGRPGGILEEDYAVVETDGQDTGMIENQFYIPFKE